MWAIVYLNDARVIGIFHSKDDAERWVTTVPNSLFQTGEELDHATINADFWIAEVEVYR